MVTASPRELREPPSQERKIDFLDGWRVPEGFFGEALQLREVSPVGRDRVRGGAALAGQIEQHSLACSLEEFAHG